MSSSKLNWKTLGLLGMGVMASMYVAHAQRKKTQRDLVSECKLGGMEPQDAERAAYQRAIKALVEENLENFRSCLIEDPTVLSETRDLPLLHYMYKFDLPNEFLDTYLAAGGKMDITSTDYVTHIRGGIALGLCLVGGQTFLHVVAAKPTNRPSREEFTALCHKYPECNISDFNNRTPDYYYNHGPFTAADTREEYVKVRARVGKQVMNISEVDPALVRFEPDVEDGIRCFTIPPILGEQLSTEIAQIKDQLPNSMHRSGKVLLPHMQSSIYSLVRSLLPPSSLSSITHIHAFSVRYSLEEKANKSLGAHRDDSHFTINLCLSDSSVGSELVFDGSGFRYQHKQYRGIVHSGSLVHHVLPLDSGSRENVIIWITLAS